LRATALPISDTTTREDSITLLRLGRILNFFKSLDAAGKDEVVRLSMEHPERRAEAGRWNKESGPGVHGALRCHPVSDGAISGRDRAVYERRETGKALLAIFLRDGVICGVTPEGHLFRHRASDGLCLEAFFAGSRESVMKKCTREKVHLKIRGAVRHWCILQK
jgi:hypothetical protein